MPRPDSERGRTGHSSPVRPRSSTRRNRYAATVPSPRSDARRGPDRSPTCDIGGHRPSMRRRRRIRRAPGGTSCLAVSCSTRSSRTFPVGNVPGLIDRHSTVRPARSCRRRSGRSCPDLVSADQRHHRTWVASLCRQAWSGRAGCCGHRSNPCGPPALVVGWSVDR